jgi:hypothetical protein
MRTFIFPSLICVVVIAGCKSNSTSPNAGTSSYGPKVGTYYILQNISTDSTGKVISIDTTKEEVVATGVTIYGASDVVEIADSSSAGWSKDTAYFRYLSDGDVSAYIHVSTSDPSGWFTYPFATQTAVTWFTVDTALPGLSIHDTAGVVGGGFANIYEIIDGINYTWNTEKVTLSESLNHSSGGDLFSESWEETFYYFPGQWYVIEKYRPGFRLLGVMQPSLHSWYIRGSIQ